MKLLFIANARIPTERAMGTAIMKQCEAFGDAGITVELLVPRRHNDIHEDPYTYYRVTHNFKIVYLFSLDLVWLGKRRIRFHLEKYTFLFSLVWYVWRSNADILYTRELSLIGLIPSHKRKVIELHHLFGLRYFAKTFLDRCVRIITITHALKEDVVHQFDVSPSKICVAPSGVDSTPSMTQNSASDARNNLGIPSGKPVAMYVGSFEEWKGYRTFLEASVFLHDRVQCVAVGGTKEEVEKLRVEFPSVQFLGFLPKERIGVNQKAADVFVAPNSGKEQIASRHTSPLKVLEYMMSGIPIVASDVLSLREILGDHSAILVPPDDPQALASGILRAIEDPIHSATIAEQAKKDVVKYDWKHRTLTILTSLHL